MITNSNDKKRIQWTKFMWLTLTSRCSESSGVLYWSNTDIMAKIYLNGLTIICCLLSKLSLLNVMWQVFPVCQTAMGDSFFCQLCVVYVLQNKCCNWKMRKISRLLLQKKKELMPNRQSDMGRINGVRFTFDTEKKTSIRQI